MESKGFSIKKLDNINIKGIEYIYEYSVFKYTNNGNFWSF